MTIIRDVLERKGRAVLTVDPQTIVIDAIRMMSEANIGAVIVMDGSAPAGIFTERDYLSRIALDDRSSKNTVVGDVMTSPLITVSPEDSTDSAMQTMTERRCRHLVVCEGGDMAGIISIGDLVKHMLVEKEAEVEQLTTYIAGSY